MSARAAGVPIVFISSTVEDLGTYRAAAKEAAIEAEFLPRMMEYFEARSDQPPLRLCLEKVDEADLVVVIVAHRCGWIPPDQSPRAGKSITRLECEHAAAKGKEVLAFAVDDTYTWPAEQREAYRLAAAAEGGKTIDDDFIRLVQQNIRCIKELKTWLGRAWLPALLHDSRNAAGRRRAGAARVARSSSGVCPIRAAHRGSAL